MLAINLKKSFKHEEMSFFFELNSNRIVLFGPSGCGKTTLLKMLAGFIKPDSGEIFIDDKYFFSSKRNINIPVYKRLFGYLPQENTLFPNMTVKENILYGLKARKLALKKTEFDNIVHRLRINHKLDSMPSTLSGGQIQRAALARTLLIRPKLLLLDEPFNALDTPVKECLRELITELADELSISIVFVTHDTEDAFIVGREIVVIDSGKVIEYGSMDKIYNTPKYVETAKLLDYKNIFPAQELSVELNSSFLDETMDKSFVCVRPDNVKLKKYDKGLSYPNMIKGTVNEVHYRGKYVRVLFHDRNNLLFYIHISRNEQDKNNFKNGDEAVAFIDKKQLIFVKASNKY